MYQFIKNASIIILAALTVGFEASAVAVSQDDPCKEIPGTWKGKWNNTYTNCRWDATIDAVNYKENVQFITKLTNGSGGPNCASELTVTINGTCQDGKLELVLHNLMSMDAYKMTGRVFSKILTLEDEKGWRNVYAYKQP